MVRRVYLGQNFELRKKTGVNTVPCAYKTEGLDVKKTYQEQNSREGSRHLTLPKYRDTGYGIIRYKRYLVRVLKKTIQFLLNRRCCWTSFYEINVILK
jgi:hypothetical protein